MFSFYQFCGIEVCKNFFRYVNGINKKELMNIPKSFLKNGVQEMMHKNVGKVTASKLATGDSWKHAVRFIGLFGGRDGFHSSASSSI